MLVKRRPSSASRSTAASQRDDEEEVADVDAAAFESLLPYDVCSEDCMLLPEDQQLAMDTNGRIYFQVRYQPNERYQASGRSDNWLIYRLDQDHSETLEYDEEAAEAERAEIQEAFSEHYGPVYIRVGMNDHDAVSGE